MKATPAFSQKQIDKAKALSASAPFPETDPRVDALVNDLIGQVADKWTMLILEVLAEKGELRFTRISEMVQGISQKMLTQTLRHMERDGLLTRKIHPVVPPKVEYKLTPLGLSLGAAFCGVWVWAAENLEQVEKSRQVFDTKASTVRSNQSDE
jgi:DNA-binding HxlR family transcriptional regulator